MLPSRMLPGSGAFLLIVPPTGAQCLRWQAPPAFRLRRTLPGSALLILNYKVRRTPLGEKEIPSIWVV